MDVKAIGSVTLILFSVIDILGAIPIILDLKRKSGGLAPLKSTLAAGFIMLAFLYLGEKVLNLFGVDIQSFAIAGALVMFIMGLEMILGRSFFKENGNSSSAGAIVPLAFPIIAGAGTMTTLVSLRSQYGYDSILVGILLNLILVYLVLRSAKWLDERIGDTGLRVMGKVFGIVLIAISIKIVTNQVLGMKTGLQESVSRIERSVQHMDSLQAAGLSPLNSAKHDSTGKKKLDNPLENK
jgi:multiple antibiotic resistance protein